MVIIAKLSSDTFVSPRIRQHVVPYDQTVVRVPVISDSVASPTVRIDLVADKKERKKERKRNGTERKRKEWIALDIS